LLTGILKIEKYHRRKQKNKVSSLEDYAEVIQETEKDFNNAMGQESLTALINLKKEKNKQKTKVSSGK
jgi:hypothetical protein